MWIFSDSGTSVGFMIFLLSLLSFQPPPCPSVNACICLCPTMVSSSFLSSGTVSPSFWFNVFPSLYLILNYSMSSLPSPCLSHPPPHSFLLSLCPSPSPSPSLNQCRSYISPSQDVSLPFPSTHGSMLALHASSSGSPSGFGSFSPHPSLPFASSLFILHVNIQ